MASADDNATATSGPSELGTTGSMDPYDSGRWVVLNGFTDDKEPLNGELAKIVEEEIMDRYVVEIPASDHIERRELVADKAHLVPVAEMTTLSMAPGSPEIVDQATGEVIPCYQHWTQEDQQRLDAHIAQVEAYSIKQCQHQNDSPSIPEWYLFSLRSSLRKWGTIPPDFAEVPPMKNSHIRCIHFEIRPGNYLEVTIMLKNRKWRSRNRALHEIVTIVKNAVITNSTMNTSHRATLVHFNAESGGFPEPACEDTTAVFIITKSSFPLTVVTNSFVDMDFVPEVNLRVF